MVYATTDTPITEIRGVSAPYELYVHPTTGISRGATTTRPPTSSSVTRVSGPPEPVKDEWIVGKALFTIPLVGYLPLHIAEVVILVVVIMILHELYLRSREESARTGKQPKKPGKKKK